MQTFIRFIIVSMLALLIFIPDYQSAEADTPLPASDWYAIVSVQDTGMLHWVNAQGEQASMPRPTLPNEAANPFPLRLDVSPNGQMLIIIAPLVNNNLGIGFYDLAAGQFVQMHESAPGETLPVYSNQAFSFTGTGYTMVLRNANTGDWRVIVFETATGNAIDQLTRTDPIIPNNFITDTTWWPYITHFGLDEGAGQTFVGLQLVTDTDATRTSYPSFRWYADPVPALASEPVVPAAIPFSPLAGLDILRTTGEVLFTGFDGNPPSQLIGNSIGRYADAGQLPTTLIQGAGYTLNSPQWLRNGEWAGYRVQGGATQPHYAVTPADADNSIPLGPNIGAINGTPDGFLATDAQTWTLYHATDLNFDAFAATVGNAIFSSNGAPFSVIYTTPEGAVFNLESLGTGPEINVAIGGDEVQAPELTCGTAPAPRLAVGENARVTFTDGAPLNIRTGPAGDFIMQIPEGTVGTVIGGPTCRDNFFWWNLSLNNGTGGWAAEGDSDGYYLEPYIITVVDQPELAPTATPSSPSRVTTQATPTIELSIGVVVNCPLSPPSQLTVGEYARTIQEGTLAMRVNLTDEFPTYQVPTGQTVLVQAGPQCLNDHRLWQVQTTINGQQVSGWVAEGSGENYYLLPGPARAN